MHLPSLLRDVLPPGTQLRGDTYRIDYALGRGGFGITYRAVHTALDQLVAIKEFYPQEHAVREGTTGRLNVPTPQQEVYRRGLQRFMREGRILARLNHPNVVRVQDLFEERGTAYLVMELINGRSLRKEMDAQGGRLPVEQVRAVVEQCVAALEAVHAADVYHLDIKPDNVLLHEDGRVVLVDFGAARQGFSSRSTRAFTVEYAAPEVLAGEKVGPESDLFELAMMAHEMLTGERPPSALERLLRDTWEPRGLSEPWESLLRAALRLRGEERPQSVRGWWEGKGAKAQREVAAAPASVEPPQPTRLPTAAEPEPPLMPALALRGFFIAPSLARQGMERRLGRGRICNIVALDDERVL
ncbi:MAG: serine/threonine protein kinase, partial [Abditibacteriales bacterium]|nr:serine/threonine protein kinase [Abditibacteriales bacterium]